MSTNIESYMELLLCGEILLKERRDRERWGERGENGGAGGEG